MSEGEEIERRFRPREAPAEIVGSDGEAVVQRYLAVDGLTQVRLRRKGARRLLTIKAGDPGLVRAEEEVELDEARFERLWDHAAGREVRKRRHELPLGDRLVAEVDVFAGHLDGLVIVELEFPDVETARGFEPPAWFGAEVTGDSRLSNVALAVADGPPPFTT
jgi:adenylate cyclase